MSNGHQERAPHHQIVSWFHTPQSGARSARSNDQPNVSHHGAHIPTDSSTEASGGTPATPKMAEKVVDSNCSVCLEQFSEPKILPCGHSFCLKCLERTVGMRVKITCPLCRQTHAVPAGGLQGFLTDFIVSHEVEILGLKSSSAKNAPVCGECTGEGPVVSYCCDCQSYLCKECSTQAHKKFRSYRGHKVIPVQDLDAASLQSSKVHYCSTHKNEVVKLYCDTCNKLICRDCTLVDHRQHSYKFVQDARKQIKDKLMLLANDGKQRLAIFKANLGEIQKVETTAAKYPHDLETEINVFCNAMVQSIERRRQQLLTQARAECQKDLQQIQGDKVFHQTAISQINAAFGLASKACKCTNDVEMILTALQSIRQLSELKEVKWDARAFTSVASSPGKFTEGTRMEANKAGHIERTSLDDVVIYNLPTTAELGKTIKFKVVQKLLDGRSNQPICLQSTTVTAKASVNVLVKYGHSRKSHEKVSVSQDPQSSSTYVVSVRLVCGGKHTIEVKLNGKQVKGSPFSLNVSGRPKEGARVKKGPDWRKSGFGGYGNNYTEGTVRRNQTIHQGFGYYYDEYQNEQTGSTVCVYWNNGHTCNHSWDGSYEIELV